MNLPEDDTGAADPEEAARTLDAAAEELDDAIDKLRHAVQVVPKANLPETRLLGHEVEDVRIRVKAVAELMKAGR